MGENHEKRGERGAKRKRRQEKLMNRNEAEYERG